MKLIALDTVIMPNVVISLPTITVQQHHLYTQLSHLVALTNQILPSDTEPDGWKRALSAPANGLPLAG